DGTAATLVLGQENFNIANEGLGADEMKSPEGIALDAAGNLYVSDTGNNRILRFDNPLSKSNGGDADAVFGQPDFGFGAAGNLEETLDAPRKLRIDFQGNLWVADSFNHRVVRFPSPGSAGNGHRPDRVIGQSSLSLSLTGSGENQFNTPYGIGFDGAGRMWVADTSNNRVLVFETVLFRPDFSIGKSLSSLKGNNVYDPSGNAQKHTQPSKKKEAKFAALVQNDGEAADTYLVASAKTNKKIKVTVFLTSAGRVNVTAATKVGGHNTGAIQTGGSQTYEIKGKPRGKFRDKRRNHPVWIQATSLVDGETDRVNGVVKHRP
ncbi:MAG: NHL repeat-containing protein, partial [Verrucomicrobiota bacterium]